jgi:hypothetical protein
MAKYGNILTILNSDESRNSQIEIVLANNQTVFAKLKDTYYVETNSKKNTREVIKDLNSLDISFIFFHNHISDGSQIKSKGINDSEISTINRMLF